MGGSGSNFFSDLWDKASGVFDKWVDFESFKFQQGLANDQRQFEASLQNRQAPVASTWSNPNGGDLSGIIVPLAIGALVVGGLIYMNK